MLELQLASKPTAIDFMSGEPAPLSGKAEVLPPQPGKNTLKQVRTKSVTAASAASSRARQC
eukprot:1636870-Prymnesium_polylepis.1